MLPPYLQIFKGNLVPKTINNIDLIQGSPNIFLKNYTVNILVLGEGGLHISMSTTQLWHHSMNVAKDNT